MKWMPHLLVGREKKLDTSELNLRYLRACKNSGVG